MKAFRAPDGHVRTERRKRNYLDRGHPFDAVAVLRLLQQTIEACDGSPEGELRVRFSNGDRLTVARDGGPEGFTIHQIGQPLIVG